jgi:three-Cys-motif partner protein
MTAMSVKRNQGKWNELVYLDLLCGPGKCIDPDTMEEMDGSPLRSLKVNPSFDRLCFSDSSNANIAALKKRLGAHDIERAQCVRGDANVLVSQFLKSFSRKTLGLAFIDPEGLEVHFSTFEKLARHNVDVLFLFPAFGLTRNIKNFISNYMSRMETFWGMEWRQLPFAKMIAGKTLTEEEIPNIDRQWVRSFKEKLKGIGYLYQDETDPIFTNEKEACLYYLLFFSKHPAGLTIWKNIKNIEPSGQRTFRY